MAAYAFLLIGAVLFMLGYQAIFSPPFLLVSSIICAAEWWRHRRHPECEVAQRAAIGVGIGTFLLFLVISLVAPTLAPRVNTPPV